MDKLQFISHHIPNEKDVLPEGIQRFRLLVEYDGTAYAGWQRQTNAMTVQEKIEKAFFSLTGEEVAVIACSRTDAGVHAHGLVCHADSTTKIPYYKLPFALNTKLPPDIRIRYCSIAPEGFHARFSTCAKSYCYTFYDYRQMAAIGRQYMAHSLYHLDEEKMREAAEVLLGTHDFSAFASSGNKTVSNVRTIYAIRVWREDGQVHIRVMGNGFLYNMVRIIAGALADIGAGNLDASALKQALETGDRLLLGPTAPASGLTLEEVFYEGDEAQAEVLFREPDCLRTFELRPVQYEAGTDIDSNEKTVNEDTLDK